MVREPHHGVLKCQCNFQSRRLLEDEETFYVGNINETMDRFDISVDSMFLAYHLVCPLHILVAYLLPERNSRDPHLNGIIMRRSLCAIKSINVHEWRHPLYRHNIAINICLSPRTNDSLCNSWRINSIT